MFERTCYLRRGVALLLIFTFALVSPTLGEAPSASFEIVAPPVYSDVNAPYNDGLLAVCINEKWGVIRLTQPTSNP